MTDYRLYDVTPGAIIRTADGLIIEKNTRPVEWAAFVTWVRAGNLPDPPLGYDAESGAAALAGVIESMRVALGLDEPPDGGRA